MKIAKNINRILIAALGCVLVTSVGYSEPSTADQSASPQAKCISPGDKCTPSAADFGRGGCCGNNHCDNVKKICTSQ